MSTGKHDVLTDAAGGVMEDLETGRLAEEFLPVVLDPAGKEVPIVVRYVCTDWQQAMNIARIGMELSHDGIAAGVRRRYVTEWGEVEG